MRHIKSAFISIVSIVLLLSFAATVAAQDGPGAGDANLVEGEVFWTAATEFEEETQSEGVFRQRGRELTGMSETSDARLDGELTMRYDADVFPEGDFVEVLWGTVSIVGAEGAWEGTLAGTSETDLTDRSGAGLTYFELAGSGAYDGLSAILFLPEDVDPDSGMSTYPLTGVVFPGELPFERTYVASPTSPEATPVPTPTPAVPTPTPAVPTPTPDLFLDD